ncbi:lipid IV(A) 3-deoxy-D-manno-octulosonic acid transferase [Methylomagnum ishizawai]|uniref:lipid IV(A) 3-deoxy-D-manno-octulosonic acid transferase n=1 Tax=Methylomagnum ishizawai TaxID=1760988 RepID=UPI001C3296CD|nr:lipid IV(A) 3-deoxy-D-manno-octulosonic acid transferase [Methylomagnum ishizawai]BBL75212.1 3-deoxy-D-manno-octulosonic acid transferase [Methylomagnum ishizawai]
MRRLYTALFYAATPFILGRLAWRGLKLPAYRERWGERFARYAPVPGGEGMAWFHAVSVGEAEAAFPLIRAFRARHPGLPILVTCTTPTGSARIGAVLGDTVAHVYLPYDLPGVVARFLDHFRPCLGVVLETEIWPNLYRECARRGIPLAIVNGRLSEKSARGYGRIAGLVAESLAAVGWIAAQTSLDAKRYVALGADPRKVAVTGNIKFDIEFPAPLREQATALRETLFPGRPVWIAGSTHPGEEEQVLAAHAQVRSVLPDALLILAPRHPDRFQEVRTLCAKTGIPLRCRGESLPCEAGTGVFLLDSLGELRCFYGAADVAFVGGSLIPQGGHNVLEPAVAGVPVLFGPHMFNFAEIARRLEDSGGARSVADADGLAATVMDWLTDFDTRSEIGAKASAFVDGNRGAVARVVEPISALLQSRLDSGRTIDT